MTGVTHGFVLAARGRVYVESAIAAGRSMRAAMPDAEIDLFTDDIEIETRDVFSQVHRLFKPGVSPKFEAILGTRFERTVYVDADVRCIADIRDIFTILDRFDVAMAHDPFRNSKHARGVWQTALPNAFPHLNGGVIGVRGGDATRALLSDIVETMINEGIGSDQAIIREKLYFSNLRLCTLPPEYNLFDYRQAEIWGSLHTAPRLVHHSKLRNATGNRLKDVRTLKALVGPDMYRHFQRLVAADHSLTPENTAKVRPLVETGVLGQLRQGKRSITKGIVRLLRL